MFFLAGGVKPVFAIQRTQKEGLFSIEIPEGWRWVESLQEIIVTYPDGKTVAIDITLVPSRNLSQAQIKELLKDSGDKMIKEGIEAHNGTLIHDKEIKFDGVYARQLDFKPSPENPIDMTYISFFNKGHAFTITYGAAKDDKMRLVMEDIVASFKFR